MIRDDSALRAARQRVEAAKQKFTDAARSAIRKEPDAPAKAAAAMAELHDARKALREVQR